MTAMISGILDSKKCIETKEFWVTCIKSSIKISFYFEIYFPWPIPIRPDKNKLTCLQFALISQSYSPPGKSEAWQLVNYSIELTHSSICFQDCCFSNRYTPKQFLTSLAITTESHTFNIFLYILWTKHGGNLWLSLNPLEVLTAKWNFPHSISISFRQPEIIQF